MKFNYKINSMNITMQLLFSYILIILIPLFILSAIVLSYLNKTLEEEITNSFHNINKQMTVNVDNFLKGIAKISEIPFYDKDIKEILTKDYDTYEYPEYEKIQDHYKIVDEFYKTIFLFSEYVDSVDLYPNNSDMIYTKGYNQSINYEYTPTEEKWYQDIIDNNGKEVITGIRKNLQMSPQDHYIITVGRSIMTPYSNESLGVFLINIKANKLDNLFRNSDIVHNSNQIIVDQNNRIVYSNDSDKIGSKVSEELDNYFDSKERYIDGKIDGEDVLIVINQSQYTSWKVISTISKDKIFYGIDKIKSAMIFTLLILVFVSVVVSHFISKGISSPLKKLTNQMMQIDYDNINMSQSDIIRGNKEIIYLSSTYNIMLNKIENLIDQIMVKEEKKRVAELNALQSQINPHFMYNTLNVLKFMAEMQGADNIVDALNSFVYILTFVAKNEDSFIQLEDELQFIKHYISILKMRYANKFSVKYDVDNGLSQIKILKFILQPFIENAIFHGFSGSSKIYEIRIRIYQDDGYVYIQIQDTGIGMSSSKIDDIISGSKASTGLNSIGISNVISRINLHYNAEASVRIDSVVDQGTNVMIKIPLM